MRNAFIFNILKSFGESERKMQSTFYNNPQHCFNVTFNQKQSTMKALKKISVSDFPSKKHHIIIYTSSKWKRQERDRKAMFFVKYNLIQPLFSVDCDRSSVNNTQAFSRLNFCQRNYLSFPKAHQNTIIITRKHQRKLNYKTFSSTSDDRVSENNEKWE